MPDEDQQHFVILPKRGVRAEAGPALDLLLRLQNGGDLPTALSEGVPGPISVIDSVQENGAKLVVADRRTAEILNRLESPVRALPLIEYPRPDPRPEIDPTWMLATPTAAVPNAQPVPIALTCVDAGSGAGVAGATVVAFTNFAAKQGDSGKTDAAGEVTLRLGSPTIDRLYVYGPDGYWGGFRQRIPAANVTVPLEPVALNYVDLVRFFYGASRFVPTAGVRVGILDTGCGPHTDINVTGGHCTVTGEPDPDWRDHGIHGTHVAGLIGASGGIRGVAPGVNLRAYRVFPAEGGATNYAILKALIFAARDQCDVVNLSLGGGPFDEIVEEAIADACNQGMLPVIAAGNDGRKAVSFPAAHRNALAVSALGREGNFPAGSVEEADVLRPPANASDSRAFIAAFSNVGPQIAVMAAGVGVLSTLPNQRYGPLSGTSMAAPVVAGAIASLLSQDSAIFGMARDRARSDAIRNLLQQNCVRFGFGSIYEGYGMPDPRVV